MRFDLTVNKMILDAVRGGVIHVQGGEQVRPHVHLRDLIDVLVRLLTAKIDSEVFNVVHSNQRIIDTAEIVARITTGKVVVGPRTDDRSYWVTGTKLARILSFIPKRDIPLAVNDISSKLDYGYYEDAQTNKSYMNVVPL